MEIVTAGVTLTRLRIASHDEAHIPVVFEFIIEAVTERAFRNMACLDDLVDPDIAPFF